MGNFILTQITFIISLAVVLFFPGYFLLQAVFAKQRSLSILEHFILSFGVSIVLVDFLSFVYDRLHVPFTRLYLLSGIVAMIIIFFAIYKKRSARRENDGKKEKSESPLFAFSKNQYIAIIVFLFLMIFTKTVYLSDTVIPTSTDMGHHMYWAQWMRDSQRLPDYDGMPDFIIGEHIVFGVLGIITGLSFLSAFPVAVLYFINLLSILAVFIFVLRTFQNKNIAILSLIFLGVLHAVSSPQAKFVSGGVIGNIMGNFLMPLSFYFYARAFAFLKSGESAGSISKAKIFLSLAVFITLGLFYTHHLTSFIFLFIMAGMAVIFIGLYGKGIRVFVPQAIKTAFSPSVLSVLVAGIIFLFVIFPPAYLQSNAVNTALGTPSKSTRAGLDTGDLQSSLGEERLVLGLIGFMFLISQYKRRNLGYSIVLSWTVMLIIMSMKPHLLFINLPSNRIGSYLSYPLAILSAYTTYSIFFSIKNFRAHFLMQGGLAVIVTFVFISGISDSVAAFKTQVDHNGLSQTFHSTEYLQERIDDSDVLIKDHNYIIGDSWIKLFFMRGYKYPQSRGYLKRYEDATKPREMCTLHMISNPDSPEARQCFKETRTNMIIVNPKFDKAQFDKLKNFDHIYSSPQISIFYRNKDE